MKTTMIYLRQLLALCVVMVAFAACGDDEKNEGGSSSASGIQLNTIDKITCLSEESTIDINFTAGSDWTAASSATWLNKLTGSAGDITLTATIHENESFDIRPATITIKDKSTGKEATISVKQASKGTILFFSSASQNGQTFDNIQISDDSKAFVATVNVTSNYDWTVNTDKSWLSYSKAADANEDGSYTVTFYADFDKLYETGKYGAQSAVAHFEYTSATRTPATVDYQLDFKGITPSLTFDVDKVELINQNGDGEYIGLATVYSNVAWDFDEKPEFVESVEVLGGCNGNLKGICQLVTGMKAEDVAKAIDVAGLTADLRRERAMSIISESGVAVEKKAEEPAKTEEASKAKKKSAAKKTAKTEETEGEEAPKAKKTTRKSTKTEEKTEE